MAESEDDGGRLGLGGCRQHGGGGPGPIIAIAARCDDGPAHLFEGPIHVGTVQASEAAVRFEGEQADDQAGRSVADGADVDGDGYDDVAVGACFNDRGGENAGAVFLFRGGAMSPAVRSLASAEGGLQGNEARAGTSVAFGELDDDGLADGIVGGPGRRPTRAVRG